MLFQGVHPAQQAGPPPLGQRKEPSACRASRLLRAVQQAVVFHLFQQAVDPGRVGRVALKLGHGLQPLEQQVTVQRAISQQAKQNGVNKAGQVAPGTGAVHKGQKFFHGHNTRVGLLYLQPKCRRAACRGRRFRAF